MQFYEFTTESEALTKNQLCKDAHLAATIPCSCPLGDQSEKVCHCDYDGYTSGTTGWYTPKQRTSNSNWVIEICPGVDDTGWTKVEIETATEWPVS